MKRTRFFVAIEIFLLILVLAGAFFIANPVGRSLDRVLVASRDTLLGKVFEQTGLTVRYGSMSPSILRSIRIHDLTVSDSNGALRAVFPDVEIAYGFRDLLGGKGVSSLSRIIVRGGTVTLDASADQAFFDTIRSLLRPSGSGSAVLPTDLSVDLSGLNVEYITPDWSISARVDRGTADFGNDGLRVIVESDARYADARGKRGIIPGSARTSVKLDSRFDSYLSSGTSMVTLRDFESDTLSIDSLRFLATLRDGLVRLDSTQDLQPVDFSLTINPADASLSGNFACEDLLPLRWIRVLTANRMLSELRDIETTGTGSFSYREGSFDWELDFEAGLPSSFLGGGKLDLVGSGKNALVTVDSIRYNGSRGRFSGNLRYDIESFSADGMLSLDSLRVLRGTAISGDFYFQPEKNGSRCIIPELQIETAFFSGVELRVIRNIDSFELSLSGFDSEGQFAVDGSLTTTNRWYLQLYGSFDSISVSNTIRTVYSIISPDRANPAIADQSEPFKATTEAYFSTDFNNLSFNCTRMVLASTETDGLFMLLTANGTESSLAFTDISFSGTGYTVSGDIGVDFEGNGEILFATDFQVNSLPYRLNGMLSGRSLSFYGDYGFALSLYFEQAGGIRGGLSFESLPVPVGKALLSLSMESAIQYSADSDWRITLERSHLEELNGLAPLATVMDFTGSIDSNGLFLNTCEISDRVSKITGYLGVNWLPLGPGSVRYEGQAVFADETGDETLNLNCSILPGDDFFLDITGTFKNLPFSRFVKNQGSENTATGSFSLSGTPMTPFASVMIESSSFRLGGFDLKARARFALDDRTCSVSEGAVAWNGNNLNGFSGTVDLSDLSSVFSGDFQTVLGNSALNARMGFSFTTDSGNGPDLPLRIKNAFEECTVKASVSDFSWKDIKKDSIVTIVLTRQPGLTEIAAGAVSGFIADSGEFSLTSPKDMLASFYASGKLNPENLLVRVDDISINAASLWRLTGLETIAITEGSISGKVEITGLLNDPDFDGFLSATGMVLKAPELFSQEISPFNLELTADKKEFTLSPARLRSGKGLFDISATLLFERWIPSSFSVKTSVPKGDSVKLNAKSGLFSASGYAGWDLSIDMSGGKLGVQGTALFERGFVAVGSVDSGRSTASGTNPLFENFTLDLGIEIGNKVEFIWPLEEFPIISGLLQADEPLYLTMNTANHQFSLKGTANIKGGEIFYVKRSFYLRQGRIEFNENENIFDPVITARAEIRERDSEGDPVRIILSAENQPLSRFSPVLSSDPVKPELELMALLGQAVTADASSESLVRDAVISSSDIFTQLSLFRQAENGIRDLLGLDLFSIRTLILQNAIFGPAMKTNADTPMTIGNYFDNTTVYMGKYLGSAMYADALLHFSYFDPKSDQNTGTEQSLFENMLVQPEFGLEVTTPFFLLRWGITPGFTPENLRTLFVPDNSVTLSWKFSY